MALGGVGRRDGKCDLSFETKSDGSGKELVGDGSDGAKNSPGKRSVVP